MSTSGGWIETNSNYFVNATSTDFVFRTQDMSTKMVIGNTSNVAQNAALYVKNNSLGIRKVADADKVFDIGGALSVGTDSNVSMCNTLLVKDVLVSCNIVPVVDAVSDLGAADKRFKDLYLTGNTIHLGETAISKDTSGNIKFIDPATGDLKNLVVSQIELDGTTIQKQNGELVFGGTKMMDNLTKSEYYTGFNMVVPKSVIHVHQPLNGATQGADMRIQLTDDLTGASDKNKGVVLMKSATNQAYLWNCTGEDVYIGAQNVVGKDGNVFLGNIADSVTVATLGFDAKHAVQAYSTRCNASLLLDTQTGAGGRKYYIRATGCQATSPGGVEGDRANIIEFGDAGGMTSGDTGARSNLMVLDRFSRLWVGRDIAPGKIGAGSVGVGGSNDTQPGLLVMGFSNEGGLKFPLIHLGRNSTSGDLSGVGAQLHSLGFRLGRGTATSSNGNPIYSNDLCIDNTGKIGLGTTQPSRKLEVNNGGIAITGTKSAGDWPEGGVQFRNAISSGSTSAEFYISRGGSESYKNHLVFNLPSGTSGAGAHFMTASTASRMFIDGSNGYVGIGTMSPAKTLDVRGDVSACNASFADVALANAAISGVMGVGTIKASTAGGTISVAGDSNTSIVNIACADVAQTVNIGSTGTGLTTINIGRSNDIVNINGTLNTVNTTNTTTCNQTIDLNLSSNIVLAANVGLNICEGPSIVSYIKTSTDRSSFLMKTPLGGEARINLDNSNFNLNQNSLFVAGTSNALVGIGKNDPAYKLDVGGAVNAVSYCNMQWAMIQGVPSLSGMDNDITVFERDITFNSNVSAASVDVSGVMTANNATFSAAEASNLAASNMAAVIVASSRFESTDFGATMNIGSEGKTSMMNIGTHSGTGTINIGTTNAGTVINIGSATDTVNIPGILIANTGGTGTANTQNTKVQDGTPTYPDYDIGTITGVNADPNLLVATSMSIGTGASPLGASSIVSDKFRVGAYSSAIKVTTLNKDSEPVSGGGVGFDIEEFGSITGWLKTTDGRTGWRMKTPGGGESVFNTAGSNLNINYNSIFVAGSSNANVAIGKNSANYKLDVAGAINATEYINLPTASLVDTGIVRLNNAVGSTTTTEAATANAVKTAYDMAVVASNLAGSKWSSNVAGSNRLGLVMISDRTDYDAGLNNGLIVAASAKAVKAAYDYTTTSIASIPNAGSNAKGLVFLSDSTACNSSTQSLAASAKAVATTMTMAQTACNIAVGKWTASDGGANNKGIVFLTDSTDCNVGVGDGIALAASAKTVYNLARATWSNVVSARSNVAGSVFISDSSDCNVALSSIAASVKSVYDIKQTVITMSNACYPKWNAVDASTSVKGYVTLSDNGSNALASLGTAGVAASPYAVFQAWNLAKTASNAVYGHVGAVATNSVMGHVLLTDATSCNSSSAGLAASAFAVGQAMAKAVHASNALSNMPTMPSAGGENVRGTVFVTDSLVATTGASGSMAASALAVKSAYNLAATKWTQTTATSSAQGTVMITDATSCNISGAVWPSAASAKAVYTAMKRADDAYALAASASNSVGSGGGGSVTLSDSVTSSSTTTAATSFAVSNAYGLAAAALPLTGGTLSGALTANGNIRGDGIYANSGHIVTIGAMVLNTPSDIWFRKNNVAGDTSLYNDLMIMKGSTGNLGIGTNDPQTRLDCAGVLNVGLWNNAGTAADTTTLGLERSRYTIQFPSYRDVTSYKVGAKIVAINKQTNSVTGSRHLVQSTDLAFLTSPNSTYQDATTEVMRITDGGSVGIGTSTPAYKLDVSGQAYASGGVCSTKLEVADASSVRTSGLVYQLDFANLDVSTRVITNSIAGNSNATVSLGGFEKTSFYADGISKTAIGILNDSCAIALGSAVSSTTYSAACWYKYTANAVGGYNAIFSGSTSGHLMINTAGLVGCWTNGAFYSSGLVLDINSTYHLGFTVNGTSYKLFVNGILSLTLNNWANVPLNVVGNTIASGGTMSARGVIADVLIYNATLTDTEMRNLLKPLAIISNTTTGTEIRSIGNVSQLSLDRYGRVGIGTAFPQHKLQVNGNAVVGQAFIGNVGFGTGWTGFCHSNSYGTTNYGLIHSRDGITVLNSATGQNIQFRQGNADHAIMTSTGLALGGGIAPTHRLTINTTGAVFAVANASSFVAKNTAGTYETWIQPRASDNATYLQYGAAGLNIQNNGGSNMMVMTNAGNVGVGTTTSPVEKLVVNGNLSLVSSGQKVMFCTDSNRGYITDSFGVNIFGSNSYPVQVRNASLWVGYTNIETSDKGNGNLCVSGNVGLGTKTPGAKLDVVGGNIRTDSQYISTTTIVAPLVVSSTIMVYNLNAQYLGGYTSSFYTNPANLASAVPATKGGTGQTSLLANKVMVGNGTSTVLSPNNLHWDNTNNRLGIGNTIPSYTLDVAGDINFTGTLRQNGTAFSSGGGGGVGWTNNGSSIYSNSNIGIGTQSPSSKLEVVSTQTGGIKLNGTGGKACMEIKNSSGSSYLALVGWQGDMNNSANTGDMVLRNDCGNVIIGYQWTNVGLCVNNQNRVGIGTTSPNYTLDVRGSGYFLENINMYDNTGFKWGNNSRFYYRDYGVGNVATAWYWQYGPTGVNVAKVRDVGYWEQLSDARMKDVVGGIENPLEKLNAINGVRFNWKDRPNPDGPTCGLLAQEVHAVFPEAVSKEEGEDGKYYLNYTMLVPLLVEGNKALKKENDDLKDRVSTLEKDVADLKALVASLLSGSGI